MTESGRLTDSPGAAGATLRLLWPQWQGAGAVSIRDLASEFPFEVARRGYAVGSAVLEAVLPAHDGPTAAAPVSLDDEGLTECDGVAAKPVIVEQLAGALRVIGQHRPARIVTLDGDCAVSVAPFSALAHRYQDDLAIVWIDSHPDVGTPASE
jgi:arginase